MLTVSYFAEFLSLCADFRIFYIFYIRAYHLKTKIILFLLLICMPFSFSCLNSLARTSGTMLNRSGESRYPGLTPNS